MLGEVFPRNAGSRAILDCLLDTFLGIRREIRYFDISRRIHGKNFRTNFQAGFTDGTAAQLQCGDSCHGS